MGPSDLQSDALPAELKRLFMYKCKLFAYPLASWTTGLISRITRRLQTFFCLVGAKIENLYILQKYLLAKIKRCPRNTAAFPHLTMHQSRHNSKKILSKIYFRMVVTSIYQQLNQGFKRFWARMPRKNNAGQNCCWRPAHHLKRLKNTWQKHSKTM